MGEADACFGRDTGSSFVGRTSDPATRIRRVRVELSPSFYTQQIVQDATKTIHCRYGTVHFF